MTNLSYNKSNNKNKEVNTMNMNDDRRILMKEQEELERALQEIKQFKSCLTQNSYTRPALTVTNVVSSFHVKQKIDLETAAQRAWNVEYNRSRSSALVIRLKRPRATAMVFATDKVNVSGASSVHQSKLAARKFARKLHNTVKTSNKLMDFGVTNIVATFDCDFHIRLEGIAHHKPMFANYEAELFPALFYRMSQPKLTFLVFANGKVNVCGRKSMADVEQGFDNIYPILKQFSKTWIVTLSHYFLIYLIQYPH